jgi:hypothetical protein
MDSAGIEQVVAVFHRIKLLAQQEKLAKMNASKEKAATESK